MSPIPMPKLDPEVLRGLVGKSLLITQDWSTREIETLCAVAKHFEALDRAGRSQALFHNELAWALFFDASTRTKSAWAGASARLGMAPVIVDGSSTQVQHGETAVETGAMLGMNSHALGIRHDLILGEGNKFMRDIQKGINDYLKATDDSRQVPIVNLQCDIDHPTQALADLLWLNDYFPQGIRGKKIAMTWAYSPSYAKPLSVAQGEIMLLTRFGADIRLAHPEGYRLMDECMGYAQANAKASGGTFRVCSSMEEAFADADVVYPKSWGPYDVMLERVAANKAKDKERLATIEKKALEHNRQFKSWICDEKKMALTAGGDALYMHCLPADIGDEVTPGIMAKHTVNVAREAQKKMYATMALIAVAKAPDLADRLAALSR